MTNLAKAILGLAILTVIVSGYFYFFWTPSQIEPVLTPPPAQAPSPAPAPTSAPKTGGSTQPAANEVTIEMLPDVFSPQTLTIAVGTTVRFVNKDKVDRWPASGFHPTHQICPGFDSKGSMKPGASYRFTFTEAKQCPMHDHLNPAIRGTIVVNPK